MMGLRDIGATLPPGFRFYPSDEELVCHYLFKKIAKDDDQASLLDIDLHTCEPWQLPEVAKLNANEWYFFNYRDRKYATGFRTNRATTCGYWKATGKDRTVMDPRTREIVGMRKTLVFYMNRAPNGIKTGWIMHEFRLETPHIPPKEDWVLCRVYHKTTNKSTHDCDQTLTPLFNAPDPTTLTQDYKNTPCGCPHITYSSTPLYPNKSFSSLVQYPQYQKNNMNSSFDLSSKNGDHCVDYGDIFWDMNIEVTCLGDGVVSNLETIGFN